MIVADVDKVEAEYVVPGVVRARGGLVQAVEVEPVRENRECAEELQDCQESTAVDVSKFDSNLAFLRVATGANFVATYQTIGRIPRRRFSVILALSDSETGHRRPAEHHKNAFSELFNR